MSYVMGLLEWVYDRPLVAIVLIFIVVKKLKQYRAGPFPESGGRVETIGSTADWEAAVKEAEAKKGVFVVDFYATWCPPCRASAPIYGALSLKYACSFYKCDVDAAPDVARAAGISAMPTFKVYKGSHCTDTIQGFNQAAIVDAITRLGVDKLDDKALQDKKKTVEESKKAE